MTTPHKAVGSYIFAGGFTLGMKAAGFDILAHLEDGTYGVKTCQLNMPDLPIFVGSESWPLESMRDEVPAVVYGNPPCAAWSALNGKKTTTGTWKEDDRINCTLKHFELLEELRPQVWVWESVERAWSTGREFVDDLIDRAVELGYSVDTVLFDAQFVGGNHRRRRLFFVATKVDVDWIGPGLANAPTAGELLAQVDDIGYCRELTPPYKQAWEATKYDQNLRDGWEAVNPPEKREYRHSSTGKTFTVGRPAFKYRKLNPSGVAPTVVGASLIHPYEPRFVSIQETKAICGYPLDFELEKDGTDAYDLLTRAVMPPVGEWFGKRVREALDRNEDPSDGESPRVRMVDLRNPDKLLIVPMTRSDEGDSPRWTWAKPTRQGGGGSQRRSERRERSPRRRTIPIELARLPEGIPGPEVLGKTKSGEYIKMLLLGNLDQRWNLSDEQIALLVLNSFENRKTTTSDVGYQRAQLRRQGVDVARVWYTDYTSAIIY